MAKAIEPSELVNVAATIDDDVRRLEELSTGNRKIELNSEKNIARAAQELQRALEHQQRLAEGLRGLGEAMVRLQVRQQAALDALGARAAQIQQRMARLSEHMQRFGELGAQAAEVSAMLQALPSLQPGADSANTGKTAAEATVLIEVDERFTALVDGAKALAELAHDEDFVDVARQADALKQKVQAMRGRLAQLVRAQAAGTS
jgi:DNA repair exonuclease SbcCD ATPase subunit